VNSALKKEVKNLQDKKILADAEKTKAYKKMQTKQYEQGKAEEVVEEIQKRFEILKKTEQDRRARIARFKKEISILEGKITAELDTSQEAELSKRRVSRVFWSVLWLPRQAFRSSCFGFKPCPSFSGGDQATKQHFAIGAGCLARKAADACPGDRQDQT